MSSKSEKIIKSIISLIRENKDEVIGVTKKIQVLGEVVNNLTQEQKAELLKQVGSDEGSELNKLGDEYHEALTQLENVLRILT